VKCDVLVIGGGPAGSSAAICLSRAGYSVVVVTERKQKEKPTETSKPQFKHFLQSIGAEQALAACEPCNGIVSDWGLTVPTLKPSILNPFGHPWFINRTRFDDEIQKCAKAKGAIWVEARADYVEFEEQCVNTKTTLGRFSAKWLLIANGSIHWASRVTSQPIIAKDSLIACWAKVHGRVTDKFLLTETCDDGWWYSCPDMNGGALACFVTDAEGHRKLKPSLPEYWSAAFSRTYISKAIPEIGSIKHVNILRTGLAMLSQKCGHRWISIGDAAMVLDPLGSSGTVTAIESALHASLAIGSVISGDRTGMANYERWSRSLFSEFCKQRAGRYQSEAKLRNSGFWNRRMHPDASIAATPQANGERI